MAKQPAIVFIARHGNRLDAADKNWIHNSPTPYDPPLTFGGWVQAQKLGERIAHILEARDQSNTPSTSNAKSITTTPETGSSAAEPAPKKRRILIHTSPFLRCLQTSIGVGSGIRQTESTSETHLHPADLKVDAFLGEWLSPDYFENISHPPSSDVMLANAQLELLHPAEEIRGAYMSSQALSESVPNSWFDDPKRGNFGRTNGKTGLRGMAAVGHAMPNRSRAMSYAQGARSPVMLPNLPKMIPESSDVYMPPTPTYAISPSDPIPPGYVAHARDACIRVRYQWDSLGPVPQDWSSDGVYGEEWSSMHRRFRQGLQRLLAYYEQPDHPQYDGDEETETVILLVTHGAGCNALIGAMTNQPVLLDVGLASMTMAVRKQNVEHVSPITKLPNRPRRGSVDFGIAEHFDMEIIASTQHLRGASNPLGLNSPRLGRSPALAGGRLVGADSPDGFTIGDPLSMRSTSSGGLGRTPSQRSYMLPSSSLSRLSSGLWNSSFDEASESSDSEILPNFKNSDEPGKRKGTPNRFIEKETLKDEETTMRTKPPLRKGSQAGLWGSAPVLGGQESPRRRWTFVDNN